MKKTLRPILSILLAFAMILPLAGVARADGDAFSIAAAPSGTTALTSPAKSSEVATIEATITGYSDYDRITWNVSSDLVEVDSSSAATTINSPLEYSTTTNKTLKLKLKSSVAPGTNATIPVTATLTKSGDSNVSAVPSNSVNVTVTASKVSSVGTITLTPSSIMVGAESQASVALTFANGETKTVTSLTGLTYGTTTSSYVTVNASSGKITGKAVGNASITATVDASFSNSSSAISASTPAPLTVTEKTGVSKDVTVSTYADQTLTTQGTPISGSSIYSQIVSIYTTAFGTAPTAGAKITYAAADSGSRGSLAYNGTTINNSTSYNLTDSITFTPAGSGTYVCTYTLYADNGTKLYDGKLTINVAARPGQDISIPIVYSGLPYSFASASNSGSTGADIIKSINGTGTIPFTSIRFLSNWSSNLSTNASGYTAGRLYTTSGMSEEIGYGTTRVVGISDLDKLYFVPEGYAGVFSIGYEALDTSGYIIKSGTLSIRVNTGSLDVSLSAEPDVNGGYSFSSSAVNESTGVSNGYSAATLLSTAIYNGTGLSSYYVRFNVSSAYNTGILRIGYNSREVEAREYVPSTNLSSLYLDPGFSGSYQVSFGVYTAQSEATNVASGTLTIYINNPLSDASFTYTTTYGKTITLTETDFNALVAEKLGSGYTLDRVNFNRISGGGTFRYNSANLLTGYSYYSRSYTGTVNANTRYLDGVTFTAPSSGAGYTAVTFSAYGKNAAGTVSTQPVNGVFHIFYSAAEIPAIEYNAYTSTSTLYSTYTVALRESDFASVYRTAMGTAANTNPQFFIRLQSLPTPGYGLLYQNYTSILGTGTQLTNGMIATGSYYVGRSTTANSVSTLTYVPLGSYATLTNAAGTVDTATYVAYNTSGTPLFTGVIRFKLAPDKTVSVTSDGLDFSVSDFYSVTATDPVLYVTFAQPLAGKLYVANGSQMIAVTPTTKLYTATATDGSYPVSLTHYVPQVGSTSPVTLTYTAHTKSGATYTNSIVVNPSKKTASTRFGDIPASTAGWAADSIDFASKYNLVKGTGGDKFSPNSNMHRGDLVLILYRLAGSPTVSGTMPYTDVTAGTGSYAMEIYNSALWASKNGIMDGIVSNNKYLPNSNITRQEYVRILYNFAKSQGASVANTGSITNYTDASKVASYATTAMQWAVEKKYIVSTDANRLVLSPEREATRAEIVTLLHRYLTY